MASPATARRTLTLVRTGGPPRGSVELEVLAREAGMHPELVNRLVRLGLLEPVTPSGATPLFPRDAARLLARAARLRQDLGLNYAGAVLACQLLTRIEALEARLHRYEDPDERPR
jgi:hypothetical protein